MKLLLMVTAMMLSLLAGAQTAEDSVKQVVNDFFLALKKADAEGIRECMADSAMLQTIAQKNGSAMIVHEEVDVFLNSISRLADGDADEQITFTSVLIDADLATVWTPYKFYYKGNFSHCGVNSFQLVRLNNRWKIISIIDTRRKTNCPG